MKKRSFLLAVASLMVLAGCGENPGTSEPSVGPEPSTPAVETVAWSAEAKALMETAIGMVLPDAPLSEDYHVENYVDENDGALTFYAYDENVGDVCVTYGAALVAAGFEDLGADDSQGYAMYGYAMEKEEGIIAVQTDYFPGVGEIKACFEIYAWIIAPEAPVEPLTEWDSGALATMGQALGSVVLPLPNITTGYEDASGFTEDGGTFVFYVYDENVGEEVVADYQAKLEAAGYIYEGVDNSMGYDLHLYYLVDEATDTTVYVSTGYFPGSSLYDPSFELQAYALANLPTITEWPAADIAALTGDVVVPSFEAAEYTVLPDEGCILVAAEVATNIEADYTAALEAAGWTVDDSKYAEEGYYALDSTGVVEVNYFYEEGWFYVMVTVDAGSVVEPLTEWPAADVAALTGDVVVPSFEAAEYTVLPDEGAMLIMAEVATNIEADYTAALEAAGWAVDDSAYETDGIIATSASGTIKLSYYYDAGMFNLMIEVVSGGDVNPEVPVGETITILPSDFGAYGTDVVLTKNEINFVHTNVMCGTQGGNAVIQMKKSSSSISNTTPFEQGIATITINDIYVSNPDYAGSVVVYAVDENGVKTAVEGVNNVYDLGGAKYFAICNEGNYAFYCGSIDIVLVAEAPAA